jgi:hypothetical protein
LPSGQDDRRNNLRVGGGDRSYGSLIASRERTSIKSGRELVGRHKGNVAFAIFASHSIFILDWRMVF